MAVYVEITRLLFPSPLGNARVLVDLGHNSTKAGSACRLCSMPVLMLSQSNPLIQPLWITLSLYICPYLLQTRLVELVMLLWLPCKRQCFPHSRRVGTQCVRTKPCHMFFLAPPAFETFDLINREGNMDNTFPNPYLRKRANSPAAPSAVDVRDGGEELAAEEYIPAYMLSDWSLERAGRGERKMDTLACELR